MESAAFIPFLQVMAGFGAPLFWQVNKTVSPSVTVWSEGGDVNVGAIPETERESEKEEMDDHRQAGRRKEE